MKKKPEDERLPKAQASYEASWAAIEEIDTDELMVAIAAQIDATTKLGGFMVYVQPVEPKVAEKAAIELERLGYWCGVYQSNQMLPTGDGTFKPAAMIHINWKQMPPNTRDLHTV